MSTPYSIAGRVHGASLTRAGARDRAHARRGSERGPRPPPDAFLDATPADALQHLADPEHTSKAIAQPRRQLQETSPACPAQVNVGRPC
jgi:hypothetical protein